mmetsp:Transcript_7266/g.17075  ORF Transcript_7266/g.17075 Transcript_7266/m.17075 type:complete len:173 (+) Transcript_7266:115-633(+)
MPFPVWDRDQTVPKLSQMPVLEPCAASLCATAPEEVRRAIHLDRPPSGCLGSVGGAAGGILRDKDVYGIPTRCIHYLLSEVQPEATQGVSDLLLQSAGVQDSVVFEPLPTVRREGAIKTEEPGGPAVHLQNVHRTRQKKLVKLGAALDVQHVCAPNLGAKDVEKLQPQGEET